MLKIVVPLILVLFIIVSLAFFGGWPFGGSDPEPVDTPQAEAEKDLESRGSRILIDDKTEEADEGAEENGEQTAAVKEPEEEVPEQATSAGSDLSADGVDAEREEIVALRARLQKLRADGRSNAYREALSAAVLADGFPVKERLAHLNDLRDLNQRLVNARAQTVVPHDLVEVESGDNLTRIARRVKKKHGNNVTPSMIMRINRMRRDVVRLGQKLAVPTESISVIVRKSDFRLYILLGKSVVHDIEVGLGRDDSTPVGSFTIQGKTKNPAWTKPDGTVVPFGAEGHIIGNRWMGFDDRGGRTGYGIHGTVDESTVGHQASDGCVRLRRVDVEELYRLVPEGAQVTVRE